MIWSWHERADPCRGPHGWLVKERPVSLMSGKVAAALEKVGYKVSRVDMDRNVAQVLAGPRPDVVFNALHGVPGKMAACRGCST